TVGEADIISGSIKKKLYSTFGLIGKLRAIKDQQEVGLIKKAAAIAKKAYKSIKRELKEGKRETDIAGKIDFLVKKLGADRPSFETIVASGANASMPHAKPTAKRIKNSEAIIVDFGARLKGYNSDLTRTSFVGKIDKHFKLIYSIISIAQSKAINKIRPGVKISEIDKAARSYIVKKGFGKYFTHALGHCIGIDVHELPSINSKNHSVLKEGMVFSVEPGIYIPGSGGVRIEDMILVTAKGHEVLTI
ncbi:MAG: aminopeptidase P family protein, partial [Candidatus Omnitrophica bacterium]|nr:aminopeptidase P family protein [Candidatus Omnitrophota bacterium]